MKLRVPTYDPLSAVKISADRVAIVPDIICVEVEEYSDYRVKITVGGVTRIVDGVALCNAVNETITRSRRRRR
jgi:hypothetical protein